MKQKKFHEVCPICGGELHLEILLRNEHWLGQRLNLKKHACSKDGFLQISDFYKSLLLEVIMFEPNLTLYVDYVHHKSTLYLKGAEKIEFKNRLIDLDYPKLNKVRQKVKVLTLFI